MSRRNGIKYVCGECGNKQGVTPRELNLKVGVKCIGCGSRNLTPATKSGEEAELARNTRILQRSDHQKGITK